MIPETNIYCTSISFACWMWILLIEPKLYSWQRVHQHIRLKHFDFLSNKLVYHIPEQKSWRRWLETHHFVYLLIKCGIKYWKEEVLWINFGKQSQWLCNDFRYFYIKRGPSIQNRSQAVATGNQVINPGISHHHPHFNYVSAAAAASLISSPEPSVCSVPPQKFQFHLHLHFLCDFESIGKRTQLISVDDGAWDPKESQLMVPGMYRIITITILILISSPSTSPVMFSVGHSGKIVHFLVLQRRRRRRRNLCLLFPKQNQ